MILYKIFKLFSFYFFAALFVISAVTIGLDVVLSVDLPAGVSVIAAPFVGAFFVAARHARAMERPLTFKERFSTSVVFAAATIFVSLSCLVLVFALNYLSSPASTGRIVNDIFEDRDGWYATLTFVYLVFIGFMTPAVAAVYSLFYERALKKHGQSASSP